MKSELATLFIEKLDELTGEIPGMSREWHNSIKELSKNCFMLGYEIGYGVRQEIEEVTVN